LTSACTAYLHHVRGAGHAIDAKIAVVEKAISELEAETGVGSASEHIRSARSLAAGGQKDLALRAVDDAERMVLDHLRPAFDKRKGALLSYLARLNKLDLAATGGAIIAEGLSRMQTEAERLDLRDGGIPAISAIEQRLISVLNDLTREARANADRVRTELADHPALRDRDSIDELVRDLAKLPLIPAYGADVERWLAVAEDAVPRLAACASDMELLRVLDRMYTFIDEKLGEKGWVSVAELPVRERGEQILDHYSRMHPEVVLHDGVLKGRPGKRAVSGG
jgi:hypothetical protein